MQKALRIMAIAATAAATLPILLLLISIPFQRLFAANVFGVPQEILSYLPVFPIAPIINCLLHAGCIALLIICCGSKKGGIWLEILTAGLLAVCVPAIGAAISSAITNHFYRFGSLYAVAANSTTVINDFCTIPLTLALALAYVTCGMSIAYKLMLKKIPDPQFEAQLDAQPEPANED